MYEAKGFYDLFCKVKRLFQGNQAVIKQLADEQPCLQPFIEYFLRLTETSFFMKETVEEPDWRLYYQLQRYLLICSSHIIQNKTANDFLTALAIYYEELAQALYEDNNSPDMVPILNSLIYLDQRVRWSIGFKMFTESLFEHCYNFPWAINPGQLQTGRENPVIVLAQGLKTYLAQKDTWYSSRSKELLSLTTHLDDIIKKGAAWVKRIYTANVGPSKIILNDTELVHFYVLYQIHYFIQQPFSKKRDTTLDKLFKNYIDQLKSYNLYREFRNKYRVFLLRILYPQKIKFFLALSHKTINHVIQKKTQEIGRLLPLGMLLEMLTRLSDFTLSVEMNALIKTFNVTNVAEAYRILQPQLELYSGKTLEIFDRKLFFHPTSPQSRSDQTPFKKILHAFFSGLIILEVQFHREEWLSDENIFWSCYLAMINSEEPPASAQATTQHGVVNDSIHTFKYSVTKETFEAFFLYKNIMGSLADKKEFYVKEIKNFHRLPQDYIIQIRHKLESTAFLKTFLITFNKEKLLPLLLSALNS